MKVNVVSVFAFTQRGTPYGRLDAEFVDPHMLGLEKRLTEEFGGLPLGNLWADSIANYTRPKHAAEVTKTYVAIDNIDGQDGFLFHQTLPESELPGRAKYKLKPYDIVVSNVRPERGAIGIVLESQAGAIGSSGLSVIRIEDTQSRNVAFAYLRSSFARTQLIRRSRGSMYPAVTKDDVAEVVVPEFSVALRSQIDDRVQSSLACRQRFFDLYAQQDDAVETYLSATLGAPPPDIVLDIADTLPIRIAKRSDLFADGANRFDAEFHRQEFVAFEAHLKALPNVIRLGARYKAFAGGNLNKGKTTFNRLRQAQLSGFGLSYTGCEAVENAGASARMTLQANDVLIGCTAHEPHYVGNRVDFVDAVPKSMIGTIVPVPDVMIIRARDVTVEPNPIFLASFLKTKWGRRQFQRLNRGVRGGHVYGQDVEAFIYVPVPPSDWMAAFNERQTKIRAARRGSITAMAEAVALIETVLAA